MSGRGDKQNYNWREESPTFWQFADDVAVLAGKEEHYTGIRNSGTFIKHAWNEIKQKEITA